jgi:O-methyltransferase involved in polyketide biosynthesis
MPDVKEKVTLKEAQETLLITLYAKAFESQRPNPIFIDAKAQQILDGVAYDFSRLKTPRKTTIMVCLRARKMDTYAQQFLAEQPQGVILHLGCGLDSRCLRVEHPQADWYDLDLPDVIELRRKFYSENANDHMISSSAADLRWLEGIPAAGRPALVIAEGLFMYLTEVDVKSLVLKLQSVFPGCRLAFDAFSMLTAQNARKHASLKETGAGIHWGIDNAHEIETWGEGIRLLEEWYFAQAEEIDKLGGFYKFMFRLAGRFKTANLAHRILYYQL